MRKLTTYWTSCAATLTLAGALGCGSDSGGLRPEALPAGQAAAKLHVTGRVTKGAAMRTAAPGAKNLSAAALADGSTLSITYAHTIRSAGASLAPRVRSEEWPLRPQIVAEPSARRAQRAARA